MQTTLRKTAAFAAASLVWIGVHGIQTPINEAEGTFAMHGGLVGKRDTPRSTRSTRRTRS
jgi:hypothetical protein